MLYLFLFMACTPAELVSDAKCLAAGMSDHQLLAYIAYQLATNASEAATPANLASLGKCLFHLSDRQLLAAIAYFQCQLNGG